MAPATVTPGMPTGISSPSDSLVIASPAPSASSLSSSGYDFVADSVRPGNANKDSTATPVRTSYRSQAGEESSFSDDDEIVWAVSSIEDLEGSTSGLGGVLSDDDFVVLGRNQPAFTSSRHRTKTAGSADSQAGTIRGVPLSSEPSDNTFSMPFSDHGVSAGVANENEKVTSELANELAKLNVDSSIAGEVSCTKTPVDGEITSPEPTMPGALPKKKKAKKVKERTIEDEALREQRKQEKKEKKKIEKEAARALQANGGDAGTGAVKEKKKKKAKHKSPGACGDSIVTPVAKSRPLPPIPVSPQLTKCASTATFVPSSNSTVNQTTPQPPSFLDEATPIAAFPLPSPVESTQVPVIAPKPSTLPKKKKRSKKGKASTPPPQPDTGISEKVSEQAHANQTGPTPYEEAVSYITSYIQNAAAHHDRICHLTLLQSLLIELQLITDVDLLPRSIRAAKQYIQSHAFLNIREYLKKRHEGPETVKSLLFPSRSALVKDMRKNRNFASLQWIKKRGLQDLLVGVFHH